jgi:hypothetical protein
MDYWHHRPTHKQAWDYFLNQTEADFFLFQEGRPTEDMQDDEKLIWRVIGGRCGTPPPPLFCRYIRIIELAHGSR